MSKNLRKLSKRADDLYSLVIRKRGKCERCGKKEYLQCHHMIGRGYHNTRWNLSNGMCVCRGCHYFLTNHSEHAKEEYKQRLGASGYEAMHQLALAAPIKQDYEQIILKLKEEL